MARDLKDVLSKGSDNGKAPRPETVRLNHMVSREVMRRVKMEAFDRGERTGETLDRILSAYFADK